MLSWITDEEQKPIGLAFLLSKIQQHVALTNDSDSATAASEDSANTDVEDDFFSFRKDRNTGVTSDNILSGYLSSSISSVAEQNCYSRLLEMSSLSSILLYRPVPLASVCLVLQDVFLLHVAHPCLTNTLSNSYCFD